MRGLKPVALGALVLAAVLAAVPGRAMEDGSGSQRGRYSQLSPEDQRKIHERNRSAIRTKHKDAYRKHIAEKNKPMNYKSQIDGSRKTIRSEAAYPKKVYTSASRSDQATTLKTRRNIGRPAAAVSKSQPMTDSDFTFLTEMAGHMDDPDRSKRIGQIVEAQKQGELLSKEDYDFMNDMGRQITDSKVSYRLHQIAEKRRKPVY